VALKKCTKCGGEADTANFYRRADAKDGLSHWCKTCVNANTKAHAAANVERGRETRRLWAARNPEPGRRWKEANKEKLKGYYRTYHAKNVERRKPVRAAWFQKNREVLLPYRAQRSANRRGAMKGAGGEHTLAEVLVLYSSQNGACACCAVSLINGYHRDHIMPIALGGSNDIGNIQLLCPPCNRLKGAKHPDEFKSALDAHGESAL